MIEENLRLKEVNFAVSNVCNASCLFCPRSFIEHKNKFMSLDTIKEIMNEVGSWQCRSQHEIVHSVLSENGEPFLNPNILDLLHEVRSTTGHTGAKMAITMFSNFSVLTEDITQEIVKYNLFDAIHVNIDGATEGSYYAMKKLDLGKVERNLMRFMEIRDAANCPIHIWIHVISHYTYTNAVKMAYGIPPVKGNGTVFRQDGPEVVEKWKKRIKSPLDSVGEDGVMFWAERYNNNPIKSDIPCPNIGRVKTVAFINPNGDWYACCFDVGNDLVVGNVLESSLMEVSLSDKRKELIRKLEAKQFSDIGFPCSRIDSCGGMERWNIT